VGKFVLFLGILANVSKGYYYENRGLAWMGLDRYETCTLNLTLGTRNQYPKL
jgi:hypothetical protein